MKNNVAIFKALGDKTRLTILSSLLESSMYVEILALRLGVTAATVSFHLKKLEEVGLVTSKKEQYYVMYSINEEILKNTLISMINVNEEISKEHDERENEYNKSILQSYIVNGKLTSIPVQYMKRKIVLEEIVKVFKDEDRYSEREVNIMLADYFDDFVSLRKVLVKDEFIKCYDGLYYKMDGKNFYGEGSDAMINNIINNLPTLLIDILKEGEKIIYELNSEDGKFKMAGISDKKGDVDRIVFSNKGKVFAFKYRKDKTLATLGAYSYSLWKKGLACRKEGDKYICLGKNIKCQLPSALAPFGVMDIEFTLDKDDFKALVNSFEEKLFIIE
ncbi:MAG: metalloregulator ArsR/SmtB family transcription factor [Clostridium sp.]